MGPPPGGSFSNLQPAASFPFSILHFRMEKKLVVGVPLENDPRLDSPKKRQRNNERKMAVFIGLEVARVRQASWVLEFFGITLTAAQRHLQITLAFQPSEFRTRNATQCYISLLSALYRSQTGQVQAGRKFPIQRGVKQGDVLSPGLSQCWP